MLHNYYNIFLIKNQDVIYNKIATVTISSYLHKETEKWKPNSLAIFMSYHIDCMMERLTFPIPKRLGFLVQQPLHNH